MCMRLRKKNSGQGEHREEANPLHLTGSAVQEKLMLFATTNELLVRSGRGVGVCRIAIGDHVNSMPRLLEADKRKRVGGAVHRPAWTHLALSDDRIEGSRAATARRRTFDRGSQRTKQPRVWVTAAKLQAWPPSGSEWLRLSVHSQRKGSSWWREGWRPHAGHEDAAGDVEGRNDEALRRRFPCLVLESEGIRLRTCLL